MYCSAMFGRAIWIVLCLVLRSQFSLTCPRQCRCTSRDPAKGVFVKCEGSGLREISVLSPDSLTNVSVLNLKNNKITSVPSKAFGVQKLLKKLYLSRNKITSLKNGSFTGLPRLNKLEISHNDLLTLSGEPFKGLKSLKFLDLSHNILNFIEGTVFKGLKRLKKLILSYNKFIIIPEATLKPLQSLTLLNLEHNDLLCDCHIDWLLRLKKLKTSVTGTCQYPEPSKNTKLKEISQKNMRCATLTLPYYEFRPNNDEVAIKGDNFTFTCGTTWIRVLEINWYKDNQKLIPHSPNRAVIDFKVDVPAARLVSTLKLKSLSLEDSGVYRCTVSSDKTRVSGESVLKVLPGGSKFCHSDVTKTSKGIFQWDNTDLGAVARLRCPAGVLRVRFGNGFRGFAYRKCGRDGRWQNVEGSECAYVDKVTQKLYNLKQFSANSTTALAICKALYTITMNSTAVKSAIDVSYIASILESLRPFMGANKKVGEVVVRVISKMMDVDQHVLADAQLKSKACSSFVLVLDVLANSNVVGTYFVSDNVGMTTVPVFPATFQGTTCVARSDEKGRLNGRLRCNIPWKNASLFSPEHLEASVHLPKSIFAGQRQVIAQLKLKFMVYMNSKLFPHFVNGTLVTNPRVYTSVIDLQLGQSSLNNMSEPIAIKYYNHENSDKYPPVAVYWDLTKKGGIGSWMENKDCRITKTQNTSISYCRRLNDKSYFALLMSITKSPPPLPVKHDIVVALEFVVYIGAGLCAFLLLITFITYAVFRKLRYNRDDAAMLMNLCLALLVSVILFAVGIYHVNNTLMCRAVGVLLHYFVLCSLLWVGCGALCLCRMLRTAVTPEEFNPVLRYYMTSWGIPLIICGITVAGNPDNYSVQNFCWLRRNPFFGAFVGPVCLVILIDIILFIRLNNLIYSTYSIMELGTCTSPLEEANTSEDEQLPEGVASKSEFLQHLNEVLPEKSDIYLYQKGSLLVLVLIVINFALALLLIIYNEPRYLYLVLNCVYAVGNVVLGAVIFVFHCLKKANVKRFWADRFRSCFLKNKNYLVDQEVIPNTDSTSDKPSTSLMNGETPRNNDLPVNSIPRIYGAPSERGCSDIQSNVSLPSSAALTIDDLPINVVKIVPRNGGVQPKKPCSPPGSDKHSISTSMSDKQSCVSAPLPLCHTQPALNDQHPPRYSYCFADSAAKKKKKKTRTRAPLAFPDKNGISSSRESGLKAQKEPQPMYRPSDNHASISERDTIESTPSELSCVREPASYLETPVPYSSCASSDVSVPLPVNMTSRPPIPGAPDVRNLGPGTGGYQPTAYAVGGAYQGIRAYPRYLSHPGTKGCHGQTRTIGQSSNNGQPGSGNHSTAGSYPNHCPRPMYGPANFSRNPDYPTLHNAIPEERYVSIPKCPNGRVGNRQSESDHVYESIDEQPNDDEANIDGVTKDVVSHNGQNGPSKPENEVTDSENTSLLGPSQGVQTSNGLNLPRRKPRQRFDKSRTRRYRDGSGRRKDPSSRSGATRSSATSLKSERIKPEPKEWIPDTVPRMTYVPIPYLMESKETRNETSV